MGTRKFLCIFLSHRDKEKKKIRNYSSNKKNYHTSSWNCFLFVIVVQKEEEKSVKLIEKKIGFKEEVKKIIEREKKTADLAI